LGKNSCLVGDSRSTKSLLGHARELVGIWIKIHLNPRLEVYTTTTSFLNLYCAIDITCLPTYFRKLKVSLTQGL
jgi:hypothetical protein